MPDDMHPILEQPLHCVCFPKTHLLVYFCPSPNARYLTPPSQWVKATLESRELLSVCLKRLKGLTKVYWWYLT